MDEFLSLNWSWRKFRNPENACHFFDDASFSDDEKDVFYCHLNEIDHIHLLDRYQPKDLPLLKPHIDPRTGQYIKTLIIDNTSTLSHRRTVQLFDSFPAGSQIPQNNHDASMRCLESMRLRKAIPNPPAPTQAELKDLEAYTGCWEQRQNERKLFLDFVRNYFNVNLLNRCHAVYPEMNEIVMDRLKSNVEVMRRTRDYEYVMQTAVSLEYPDGSIVNLIIGKEIEQFGHVWHYSSSLLMAPVLPRIQIELLERPTDKLSLLAAEKIAIANDVDVVLTPSLVKQFLDSHTNVSESWAVQMTIRKYPNHMNVCYFEELMPKTNLSSMDRNKLAYEYRIRTATSSPNGTATYCLLRNRYLNDINKSLSSNETKQDISVGKLEYRLVNFDEYLKNNTTKSKYPSGNYSYRLCTLGESEASNGDSLKLILRTSQDVCERSATDEIPQFVNLSTKVEYKLEFGAEQMSRSELISEWCDLYFSPGSVTDRVRLNVETGSVVSVTRLKLADVEADLFRLYQIRPTNIFHNLFEILKVISKFPPNEYLLRHESKNDHKILIYVQSKEKMATSLNLEQIYSIENLVASVLDPIPWLPIDEMELTDCHRMAAVMPCAFPPKVGAIRKNKIICNDREKLLKSANSRLKSKAEATDVRKAKARRHKKQKRETKRKIAKKLASAESVTGETIDPYLVFDEAGNISVERLLMSSAAVASTSQATIEPFVLPPVSYSFSDYQTEALCDLSPIKS